MNDYLNVELFLRIEQIADLYILLRDAGISYLTFLHASFPKYSFNYFPGIQSVTFHAWWALRM